MNNTKSTLDDIMSKAQADAIRLKQYFPFRICWFAVNPASLEYEANATTTRAKANALAKKGWNVFIVN